MKRILTVALVMLAGATFAGLGHCQGYGYPGGYGPAPQTGPNPYGVSPSAQAAYGAPAYAPSPYAPPQYGPPQQFAPQQYAPPQYGPPQQYAPPQHAPVAYPQQYMPSNMPGPAAGPMPGGYPAGGYSPAAYAQPPMPPPAEGYAPEQLPTHSYGGESIVTDPGYGIGFQGDYCSSCGANCGACVCGDFGHGGCGYHWCYSPLRQAFGSLELINWYRHGTVLPPLVTTAPQGTARDDAGDLGFNGTRVLFGNDRVEDSMTGIRFTIGTWFDPNKEYGVVYRLSAPGTDEVDFDIASDGNGVPTIARPFFNVDNGMEDALLIAFNDPGNGTLATGNLSVSLENEIINHDLYALLMIRKGSGWRTDLLLGYQNTQIEETLTIRSRSTSQSALFVPGFAVGTTFDDLDVLSVENDFHGGTIGLVSELQQGPWSMRFLGKLAIGGITSTASVSGISGEVDRAKRWLGSPVDEPMVSKSTVRLWRTGSPA